ncbi:IS3 family transposase [Embleya sp. NPDC020630]|uniref:IS3 family transposase n=1 Tax=Embleya sp. NPDC020630 TaxID=3363979 RepID=UPI0037ADAB03
MTVSRAAFRHRRAAPCPRAVRDAQSTGRILDAHRASRGSCGAPRVHAVLVCGGVRVGRCRVARLMRAAGLVGRHRRRGRRTAVPVVVGRACGGGRGGGLIARCGPVWDGRRASLYRGVGVVGLVVRCCALA